MVMAHQDLDGDETLEPFDTDDLIPLEVPAAAAAAINNPGLFPTNVSACLVTTPHDQKDKETLREYKAICDQLLPGMRSRSHLHNLIFREKLSMTCVLSHEGTIFGGCTFRLFRTGARYIVVDILTMVIAQKTNLAGMGNGTRLVNAIKMLALQMQGKRDLGCVMVTQADDSCVAINFWRKQLLVEGDEATIAIRELSRLMPTKNVKYQFSVPMYLLLSASPEAVTPTTSTRAQLSQQVTETDAEIQCICDDGAHRQLIQCDFCGSQQHYDCVQHLFRGEEPDIYICPFCTSRRTRSSAGRPVTAAIEHPAADLRGRGKKSPKNASIEHPSRTSTVSARQYHPAHSQPPPPDRTRQDSDTDESASPETESDSVARTPEYTAATPPELTPPTHANDPRPKADGVSSIRIRKRLPRSAPTVDETPHQSVNMSALVRQALNQVAVTRRPMQAPSALAPAVTLRAGTARRPPSSSTVAGKATTPRPTITAAGTRPGFNPHAASAANAAARMALLSGGAPRAAPSTRNKCGAGATEESPDWNPQRQSIMVPGRRIHSPLKKRTDPKPEDAFGNARDLVSRMVTASDEDLHAKIVAGPTAAYRGDACVKLLDEVGRWAKAPVDRQRDLLTKNFLGAIRRWLWPTQSRGQDDDCLPVQLLRSRVFVVLKKLGPLVELGHLKRSKGLVRVLRRYSDHALESAANRQTAAELCACWEGLLGGHMPLAPTKRPAEPFAERGASQKHKRPGKSPGSASGPKRSAACSSSALPSRSSSCLSSSCSSTSSAPSLSPHKRRKADANVDTPRRVHPDTSAAHLPLTMEQRTRPLSQAPSAEQPEKKMNCKRVFASMVKAELKSIYRKDQISKDAFKLIVTGVTAKMSALVKQQQPLLYTSVPFECPDELLPTYHEAVENAVGSARSS